MQHVASLIAGFCVFASPAQAQLAGEERLFVQLLITANFISVKCSGYDTDVEGTVKYGEKIGVDAPRLSLAAIAAAAAGSDREYDRSELIPEVTRLTRNTLIMLVNKKEKDVCANAPKLLSTGMLKRK